MLRPGQPLLTLTAGKAIILIVLLGWIAYANSLTKAFLLDDEHWIVANDSLLFVGDDFGLTDVTAA